MDGIEKKNYADIVKKLYNMGILRNNMSDVDALKLEEFPYSSYGDLTYIIECFAYNDNGFLEIVLEADYDHDIWIPLNYYEDDSDNIYPSTNVCAEQRKSYICAKNRTIFVTMNTADDKGVKYSMSDFLLPIERIHNSIIPAFIVPKYETLEAAPDPAADENLRLKYQMPAEYYLPSAWCEDFIAYYGEPAFLSLLDYIREQGWVNNTYCASIGYLDVTSFESELKPVLVGYNKGLEIDKERFNLNACYFIVEETTNWVKNSPTPASVVNSKMYGDLESALITIHKLTNENGIGCIVKAYAIEGSLVAKFEVDVCGFMHI